MNKSCFIYPVAPIISMQNKVCPKCKSRDVDLKAPFIWFGDRIYTCKKCGFSSPLFPEENKAKKAKK
jgi:transposase-like protein